MKSWLQRAVVRVGFVLGLAALGLYAMFDDLLEVGERAEAVQLTGDRPLDGLIPKQGGKGDGKIF